MADSAWTTQVRRMSISEEILSERDRQDEKFGPQWEMPLVRDPRDHDYYAHMADMCKHSNGDTARDMFTMLREEVYEAGAESDPAAMRAELVQVAAVVLKMVEAIDRSAPGEEDVSDYHDSLNDAMRLGYDT